MTSLSNLFNNLFNKIPGRGYLFLAILIFAAANSVVRKLTDIGAQHLIDGRNPISFCNTLFVGNLCALIVLIALYGKQWTPRTLKQLSAIDWLALMGVAILSGALAPSLTFMALDLTMVNNVVLIGRIEPPLILALSVWLLGDRVNRWVVAGAVVSFIGVVLTIVWQSPSEEMVSMGTSVEIGKGEIYAALGAIALACSTIISKIKLRQIPLGIFTIFRTAIGAFLFFVITVKLLGADHFIDAFSPFVWQWMLIYGAAIVVGGQLCWFQGLKTTGASEVSLASSFSPIAGILAAYFILGETPTTAQYIGGSVIVVGIILNQIGVRQKQKATALPPPTSPAKELEMETGFKGI